MQPMPVRQRFLLQQEHLWFFWFLLELDCLLSLVFSLNHTEEEVAASLTNDDEVKNNEQNQ